MKSEAQAEPGDDVGGIRIMQLNVVNKMLTPLPLNLSTADVSTS